MSKRLIRKPEMLARVGYSDMHIWRLEQAGKFPRRVRLGPQAVAWVEEEVDAWIEGKMKARDGEAA